MSTGLAFDQCWRTRAHLRQPIPSNHASVSLNDHMVAVLGGRTDEDKTMNLVSLLDLSSQRWLDGPKMNEDRRNLAAVVCNDYIYAIGGTNESCLQLDTLERIPISSLTRNSANISKDMRNNNTSNDESIQGSCWEPMNVRLAFGRSLCAAVAVHNRFVVVMGGIDCCAVEVIDTMAASLTSDCTEAAAVVSITRGPDMTSPLRDMGAVVYNNQILVVGGTRNRPFPASKTVESIDITSSPSSASLFPSSSSWIVRSDHSLSIPRHGHAVCLVGTCAVVAGGWDDHSRCMRSVEVLDLQQNVSWKLPHLPQLRNTGTLVSISDELLYLDQHVPTSLPYVHLTLTAMGASIRRLKESFRMSLVQRLNASFRSSNVHDVATRKLMSSSSLKDSYEKIISRNAEVRRELALVQRLKASLQSRNLHDVATQKFLSSSSPKGSCAQIMSRHAEVGQLYNTLIFYHVQSKMDNFLWRVSQGRVSKRKRSALA